MKPNTWVWSGKVVWGLVVLAVGIFTLVGISPFLEWWQQGSIGVYLDTNGAGQVTLDPLMGREAEAAGIQTGDVLLAVNGASMPGGTDADGAIMLLKGPAGEDVSVTIRKADGTEKTLSITRSRNYMQGLRASGLTLSVLAGSYLTLGILASFLFVLLSAWRFWREDPSLVSTLIAFLLLFLPYSLNLSNAYLGAETLGLYWLYSLVRACGLLSLALFLFLFPSGTFIPAWGRWAAGAVSLWTVIFYVDQLLLNPIPSYFVDWLWVLIFVLGLFAQGLRYRSLETEPGQRSAQKKVMLAGAVVLAAYILIWLPGHFFPQAFFDSAGGIWFGLVSQIVWVGVAIYLGLQLTFSKQ
jgi:hypothetical protein